MGNGIAHTFAQSGFTVKLIDVSENLWIKEWQQLPPI
jgi:3-hydroxyacyl-CoA dehydrogenase